MAIGIVNREDFERERARYVVQEKSEPLIKNSQTIEPEVITPIIEPLHPQGRGQGNNNVPESLRKILAETALLDGRQAALAIGKAFGVSESSVSAYANGATSTATYKKPHKRLSDHIKKHREAATWRAQKTLRQALDNITDEKLAYTDAKDLSGIAKDMSVVIKNLEPSKDESQSTNQNNGVQFVIYAPQFKPEEQYEVINHTDE